MKQHPLDADLSVEVERLVQALRADLPAASDASRVRNRLVSAGVLAAGFSTSAAAAAVAKSNFPVNTAQASLDAAGRIANAGANATSVGANATGQLLSGATQTTVQAAAVAPAGLLAKVIALPAAVKAGAGGGLIALALGTAPALERSWLQVRVTSQIQEAAPQNSPQRQQMLARGAGGAPASVVVSRRPGVAVDEEIVDSTPQAPAPQPAALVKHVEAKVTDAVALPTKAAQGSVPNKQRQSTITQAPSAHRSLNNDGRVVVASDGAETTEPARAVSFTVSSLSEETPLISKALQALRAGDVTSARAALGEHERRFPSGVLSPERERTRAKLIE